MVRKEASFFFAVPALVWQALFLLFPLIIVLYHSFWTTDSRFLFTFEQYRALWTVAHIKIIARSLMLAIATAATCFLLALPVSYFLARRAQRYAGVLLFFLMLPFWTNFLVLVYSWFFLLEHNGLINELLLFMGIIKEPLQMISSVYAVFAVMVYCYLPFMVMPLYSILEKLDRRLLEASYDLGATSWETFRRITFPLALPGIKTGLLLVLVPAFGEFAIPSLVGGSKHMMVGSLISHYFLVARDSTAGAAFTVMSSILLFIVAYLLNRVISAYCATPTTGGRS